MDIWIKQYQDKLRTAEEIALEFKNGDRCLSNGQVAEPVGILQALTERAQKEDLRDIHHYLLLPMKEQTYMEPGMDKHIRHYSHFISEFDREMIWENRGEFIPAHYSQVPAIWRNIYDAPDIFYCTVAPMDEKGYFSCGTAADLSEIRRRAGKLLLEVNPTMPRTFGSAIHISEVTALIENDEPITEVPAPPITPEDEIIGGMIAEEIPDGATIQLGIGSIPNVVAKALQGKRDLGIHSEMFCDSMVNLCYSGVVTNARKNIHRGKSVAAFTFGTRDTYDYIDNNQAIEFLPVDYVNDPRVVAKHEKFISINSCIEVDLFGQVCSETMGVKNYSGVGGQLDFIRGAAASKGGKSFLAFKSSAKGGIISKIKPMLTPGACVTTTRNDVDYIVTENGMVRLKGMSCSERAKALISIAHPNFREELTRAAKEMHIIV